ncbi:hypothetical protein Slin14017_G122880 [Septoria linicola]|nr:hypothetical protein Slin14017_G122880 [Septoria linicola]
MVVVAFWLSLPRRVLAPAIISSVPLLFLFFPQTSIFIRHPQPTSSSPTYINKHLPDMSGYEFCFRQKHQNSFSRASLVPHPRTSGALSGTLAAPSGAHAEQKARTHLRCYCVPAALLWRFVSVSQPLQPGCRPSTNKTGDGCELWLEEDVGAATDFVRLWYIDGDCARGRHCLQPNRGRAAADTPSQCEDDRHTNWIAEESNFASPASNRRRSAIPAEPRPMDAKPQDTRIEDLMPAMTLEEMLC